MCESTSIIGTSQWARFSRPATKKASPSRPDVVKRPSEPSAASSLDGNVCQGEEPKAYHSEVERHGPYLDEGQHLTCTNVRITMWECVGISQAISYRQRSEDLGR